MSLHDEVETVSKETPVEVRMNVLLRLLAVVFIAIGITIAYSTSTTPLFPPLAAIIYLASFLLVVAGIVVGLSRFK